MNKTIVLVHGAWVTPASWNIFRQPLDSAGFTVHAPAWPLIEGRSAAELNAEPPAGFGGLTVGRIADKYQAFIATLPEAPILVGHSFGGLLVQMLLDRGVGAAGVAINPAPIGGIVPGPGALRAIAPILLRLGAWRKPYRFTRRRFAQLFANGASEAAAARAYDCFVIPAPGMIFHQAAFWLGTGVNPGRRRQPLLITGGDEDRLVSLYLSRTAFRRQSRSPARTDYLEFPGRSHFLIAEPGWETVAASVLSWIENLPAAQPVPSSVPPAVPRPLAVQDVVPALARGSRQ